MSQGDRYLGSTPDEDRLQVSDSPKTINGLEFVVESQKAQGKGHMLTYFRLSDRQGLSDSRSRAR